MPNAIHHASLLAFAALAALAAMFPLFTSDQYLLDVAMRTLQSLLMVMSLHVVLSTGRLNLAHISFMGIGAYLSAGLVMGHGFSPWLAAPIAILVAAAVALALGIIILRLAGAYFFLVTFAFLNVVVLFFQSFFPETFGGSSGLINVPTFPPIELGFAQLKFETRAELYYLLIVLFLLLGAFLIRLDESRFGLIFDSLRQSERVAESVGINPLRYKTEAFVASAMVAATIGVFFAHSQKVVHYTDFNGEAMLRLVVFIVVGGVGSMWGAIIGTLLISLLIELLRGMHAYETVLFGAILVGSMLFLPEGIGGILRSLRRRLRRSGAQA